MIIELDSGGFLHFRECYYLKDTLKRLGAVWDKPSLTWKLFVNPENISKINRVAEIADKKLIDELTANRVIEIEKNYLELERLRKLDDTRFKISGLNARLLPYQKVAVRFGIANNDGLLLADQMGLGKCVKNSYISSTYGRLTMKEVYERHVDENSLEIDNEGGEWFHLKEDLGVLGIVNNKIEYQNVKKFYREKVSKIGKFKLRDGSEHEAGLNHKYLSLDGWKSVQDIEDGDWISVASKIYVEKPHILDIDLVKLIAWQISEGCESKTSYGVSITQNDINVLKELKDIVDSLGLKKQNNSYGNIKVTIVKRKGSNSSCLTLSSKKYKELLVKMGYAFGSNSGERIIPRIVQDCQIEGVRVFLKAYFDAEGCCNKDNMEVWSKSKEVIKALQYMLRRLGILGIIGSSFKIATNGKMKEKEEYWYIKIGGIYARIFNSEVGFGCKYKQDKLDELCKKTCNTNIGYSIPCKRELSELLELTGISYERLGFGRVYVNGAKHQNPSRELINKVIDNIDDILENGLEEIKSSKWSKKREGSINKININRDKIIEVRNRLGWLSSEDIIWLEIFDKQVTSHNDYVYDLSIDGEPNYLADMAISHNTLESLSIALYLKYKMGFKHFLIVTPASLKWNWPKEIEKFTDEKYVVIDGIPKVREKQWLSDSFFKIVNYELLAIDLGEGKKVKILKTDDEASILRKTKLIEKQLNKSKMLDFIKNRGFQGMIVDEIHMIKTHDSLRSKTVKKLSKKSDFRLGLTGTPIDGKLEELHSIMEFVRPGLFGSKYRFMNRYSILDFWGRVKGYKHIKEVREKIQPYFLRRLKNDVLKDLPDKVNKNYYIELNKEERELYNKIKDGEDDWWDLEPMVKAVRCKQLCDHSELLDVTFKKNTKFDLLFELLVKIIDESFEKVIIFSQYKQMTDKIIREIKKRKYKYLYICGDTDKKLRVEYQAEFNENDEIDIIIGTEAMSTGLNLTSASYVINYDDNWSNSYMEQRADRAHRIGQLNSVTVINFVCKDTVEERIRDVLYTKSVVTDEVLGDGTDEVVLKRLSAEEIEKLL